MTKLINLPNILSCIGIFVSFVNIISLSIGNSQKFAFWILLSVSLICDLFDGFLARKLNQVTQFGKWLDSCGDVLLYLILPFLYLKQFIYVDIWFYFGWIIIFVSGIYRLQRFSRNGLKISSVVSTKKYYLGLPVYFSLFFTTVVMIFHKYSIFNPVVFFVLATVIGVLFISKIQFYKFNVPESISTFLLIIFLNLFVL
jgi:CDP-diacylglycerol---serine O-phosphatidyltransferase